ncbi:MAG: cysteine-rich VLP domain-containing protein [Clostridia bacterium]|nr:cysteine-rich VLP domain-containing protein [Clostridia bacterium]MDO4618795.1 cysteine-rich VLP domain-containing protein [Clostridia bacterium]
MMKITPKQAARVNRLVKELCANYDSTGNCILLDDGEAHRCVQLISIYGIYCNYFKDAVLPSDRELYEQIKKINKLK